MAFNPADFPKPSLGFLTGFVDTKGMQIAHVSGERAVGCVISRTIWPVERR